MRAGRWVRRALVGLGCLALLVVAACVVFAVTFDPNSQKERIVDAVRRATGRELVLAGPLRLGWGLSPALEADDAALANRPGGTRPQMATVARISARVALLPLLQGRVEIEQVTLDRPDILLETDAQGVGNWQFSQPPSPGVGGPAGASGQRARVALRRLVIQNGRVTWHDGVNGRTMRADLPGAVLSLSGGQAHLTADAQVAGQALHMDATVGEGAGPWPLTAALTLAGATLHLDGIAALPVSGRSFQGRVALEAPDLAALGAALGEAALPPLHDVRLGVTLAPGAEPLPQDFVLHVGASDLGAWQPGATLAVLDVTLPSLGQPGRLAASGALPAGPWSIASGLIATRQTVALRGLAATAPQGDLAGDVAITRDPRWAVRGTLVAQRLDIDALRAQPPAPPRATPNPSPPPPPASPKPPRLFSDAPLPWERLRVLDADLQVTAGTLRVAGADYHALATHVVLRDGALHLDPFAVQAPEGRVDASLSLDAAQAEPPVALALRAGAFALDPVLQLFGLPAGSDAPVELDVAVNSAGRSPHALAAGLNGHAGLAMVEGSIANAALAAVLGNAIPAAGRLDAMGRTPVRCLALRLNAAAGQVSVAALTLDTPRLVVNGEGTIDLRTETIALRLQPAVRVGGAQVQAPMRAEGSLVHPALTLDPAGVSGRTGFVIGGPPAADGCPPALALARDNRAGRMPAEAAGKGGKPADLLRSFLR